MMCPSENNSIDFAGFPAPVRPSPETLEKRRHRLGELTRITLVGVGVRALVIVAEFVAATLSGSAALRADAIASLFDVVSSMVLLAAIHFAARPPDDDHPFGHGRAEPLAGFQLGILLAITGMWLAFENVNAVVQHTAAVEGLPWLWSIPALSSLVLGIVAWRIHVVGKRARSTALAAEASHYLIDMGTTLIVTVILIAAAILPSWAAILDRIGGFLLAILMIGVGGQAARENLHQLLDRIPHDQDFSRVRTSALAVAGVVDVEKVRIQTAGPDVHVDIDIEVDPEISVAEAHVITQHVRARIQSDWAFVREVVVHVEPYYEGDH